MEELQLQHASEQWRHFIDLSKVSVKAVLLHEENKHLAVPLVHAAHVTENCSNIHGMLNKMCYEYQQWNLRADLKVVAKLTGL
jgi:hypothetical protein